MDESLSILESLPAAHRRHVLAANQALTKGSKNRNEKLQIVASSLDPAVLSAYRELYQPGNGRLFSWYLNRELDLPIDLLESRLLERYEHARRGEKPEPQKGEAPKFHRMSRVRDVLQLDYVYYGGTVIQPNGWDQTPLLRFRFPSVVIRQMPFTMEFRRAPVSVRDSLLSALREDLGILSTTSFAPCRLDTDALRATLEERLDAVFIDEQRIGRDRGLGTFRISTNRKVALYTQVDYLRNKLTDDIDSDLAHHVVHARSWSFVTRHANDDYMEYADYTIALETGDIRIGEGASETAIENLRRNVLELF